MISLSPLAAWRTLGIVVACLAATRATAAAIPQTPVNESRLVEAPFRDVGLVENGAAYRGSGFAVGERVVLTAAHIFFDENEGTWFRSAWKWQPAPTAAEFGYARAGRLSPRTHRVLAGYAAAAAARQPDRINRDVAALLFFDRATPGGTYASLAYEQAGGTDTYSFVGYPGEIGGTSTLWGRMYAHGDGVTATFARTAMAADSGGWTNALFETYDLLSGGGQSGGPLFRLTNAEWRAVGLVIARTADYSRHVVRELDGRVKDLVDTSLTDTLPGAPGEELWAAPVVRTAPVFRADGSIVVRHWNFIVAYDADGHELWRAAADDDGQIAETPDGRIISTRHSSTAAYAGDSGALLWRAPVGGSATVGVAGEIYVPADGQITVLNGRGEVSATFAAYGNLDPSAPRFPPVIAADGHLYYLSNGSLYSVTTTGVPRWQHHVGNFATLAATPAGLILVWSSAGLEARRSDGSLAWAKSELVATKHQPVEVLSDGRLLLVPRNDELLLLSAAGDEQRRVARPGTNVLGVAIDANDTIYVSDSAGIHALPAGGTGGWTQAAVYGELYAAPGGRLVVRDPGRRQMVVVRAGETSPAAWSSFGGPDRGHRAPNAPPVGPTLARPPTPAEGYAGFRLELNVEADGSPPLYYEWRRDGQVVPGAFGPRLVLPQATLADAGAYTVTIRNPAGTVTTAPVTVKITEAVLGAKLWAGNIHPLGLPAIGHQGTVYTVTHDPISAIVATDGAGNELWRHPIDYGMGSFLPEGGALVAVDGLGNVYASSDRHLYALTESGTLRWKWALPGSEEGSYGYGRLAIAADNSVYVSNRSSLTRFLPSGERAWHLDFRANGITSIGRPMVRRDAQVALSPGLLIKPDGTATRLAAPLEGALASLLGPADTWISSHSSDRLLPTVHTLNVLSPAGLPESQTVIGSPATAHVLTTAGHAALVHSVQVTYQPMYGGTATQRPLTAPKFLIGAVDEGALLVRTRSHFQIARADGSIVREAPLADLDDDDGFTLSSRGHLVGGSPLRAYFVGSGPGRSPWPLPNADPQNTARAPVDFIWPTASSAPQASVDAVGRIPYTGAPLVLRARATGQGPLAWQWQRNGVDIPGATSPLLSWDALGSGDSGRYRVVVTNAIGSTTSSEVNLFPRTPSIAPPGLYLGRHIDSSGRAEYVALLVHPDRSVEALITPASAVAQYTRLDGEGWFGTSYHDNATRLQFTPQWISGGGRIFSPLPFEAGHAPNGLPAGFYRGGSDRLSGAPAYAVVLTNGELWWSGSFSENSRSAGWLVLPPTALTAAASVPQAGDSRSYTVTATKDGVIRFSSPHPRSGDPTGFTVTWVGRERRERLINLSTRGQARPDEPVIAGFATQGDRQLLLRGAGPALTAFNLPAESLLPRPQLALHLGSGALHRTGGAWSSAAAADAIRTAAKGAGAFPFPEGGLDAALLETLPTGVFTTVASGGGGGSGVVLAEIYDTSADGDEGRLVNLSTRGWAASGERALIGGFVINGEAPVTLVIRAVGPALGAFLPLGRSTALQDPVIRLYDAQNRLIASNQYWWNAINRSYVETITAAVGAFPLTLNDAGLVVTLEPGAYTAAVEAYGAPGTALFELYVAP